MIDYTVEFYVVINNKYLLKWKESNNTLEKGEKFTESCLYISHIK